jgi:hypothetical protein
MNNGVHASKVCIQVRHRREKPSLNEPREGSMLLELAAPRMSSSRSSSRQPEDDTAHTQETRPICMPACSISCIARRSLIPRLMNHISTLALSLTDSYFGCGYGRGASGFTVGGTVDPQ